MARIHLHRLQTRASTATETDSVCTVDSTIPMKNSRKTYKNIICVCATKICRFLVGTVSACANSIQDTSTTFRDVCIYYLLFSGERCNFCLCIRVSFCVQHQPNNTQMKHNYVLSVFAFVRVIVHFTFSFDERMSNGRGRCDLSRNSIFQHFGSTDVIDSILYHFNCFTFLQISIASYRI